jgi:hypothetical protein
LQEVIAISKRHPSVISIQMAVTACLYYLSRHEISLSIHPKYLREVRDLFQYFVIKLFLWFLLLLDCKCRFGRNVHLSSTPAVAKKCLADNLQ